LAFIDWLHRKLVQKHVLKHCAKLLSNLRNEYVADIVLPSVFRE
jgi:hypothetical protein